MEYDKPALRLGAWNYYFLAKFLLFWRELIGLHALENLAFVALLAVPVRSTRLRLIRNLLAAPAAVALLYYDSWLPPITRVFSQAGLVSNFSVSYLIELMQRFISWPVVALLAIVWVLYLIAARYLRIGVLVVVTLMAILFFHGADTVPGTAVAVKGGAGAGTEVKSLDTVLKEFYAGEARRNVKFTKPPEASLPFDLIFIHVCSLSWDDLQVTGLEQHPLWQSFDFVLRRFNSAASYSGPAAIRILRANCGQSSHQALYAPVPENCYLMPSLKQTGFETDLVLNHDGHFDDFLSVVQKQGELGDPMPLTGISIPQRSFDDSAIYDDLAVLTRWFDNRQKSDAPRVATFYNTVSLHDGNHLLANPKLNSLDSYQTRLSKLLDDLDSFMRQIERSGRRAVVAIVPEHGAAIRGDKMQIAGLREIASPAITTVPVGIKVIGPGARRVGAPAQIKDATSYLALSHIVSKMLEKSPYGADGFAPGDFTAGLPVTELVSENEENMILRRGEKYFLRSGSKEAWKEYPATERP